MVIFHGYVSRGHAKEFLQHLRSKMKRKPTAGGT